MQRQRPSTSWRNHTSKVRLNPYKKTWGFISMCIFTVVLSFLFNNFIKWKISEFYISQVHPRNGSRSCIDGEKQYNIMIYTILHQPKTALPDFILLKRHSACGFSIHANNICSKPQTKNSYHLQNAQLWNQIKRTACKCCQIEVWGFFFLFFLHK